MQVRRDRRDSEAPFKPQREITDDAERHEEQRQCAIFVQLLANLRSDELDALLSRRRIVGFERGHDPLRELGAGHAFFQRQANERGVRAAEALRRIFAEPELVDGAAHAIEVHGMLVRNLDDRSTAEVDAEIESARREE